MKPIIDKETGVRIGSKAKSKDVPGKWVNFRPNSGSGEPTVGVKGIEGNLRKIKFVQE